MSKMSEQDSVFDDVLTGLKEGVEWARGQRKLRTTQVELPPPPPVYSAAEIRAIRLKSGMSQGIFSRYLSISAKTLQAWEQGTRRPSPLSARFLQVVECCPEVLSKLK